VNAAAQVALSPAATNADDTHARRSTQNWVLDPLQDSLFIIVAPLIVLAGAVWAFAKFGAAEATSFIIVAHIIMTVAHHLPTFIRVYGDVDLFKRFKWSFLLGPVIPLAFSACMLFYINAHDLPVESFLYLYIMLVLWDPWHFLRQHYGFMRIYDRPNAAPRKLAANMDLWLCVSWFAHIMVASGAWLPELLRDLYVNAGMPLILGISTDAIAVLGTLTAFLCGAMTAAYAAYLFWCRRQRYFISAAKLALFAITFGVMYLTYTPNEWIQSLAPGWTFKVGFAAVGIVHMTQYLAIVWRYNRSLAANANRARSGVFRRWHGSAKWATVLGVGYVGICLAYGDLLTTKHEGRALMSVLLALGFTSTLMHYYFDGFIWKMRHKQNSEALTSGDSGKEDSWWTRAKQMTPTKMLLRQVLYFGVPMLLLSIGAAASWSTTPPNYVEHMYRAQSLSQKGLQLDAEHQARLAFADMSKQLPLAEKVVELAPSASREAELAFLIYNHSLYENRVMPQLNGRQSTAEQQAAHTERIRIAERLLASALDRRDPIAHPGRATLTRKEAQQVLESWRRLVG
jgi:hypothetical protein